MQHATWIEVDLQAIAHNMKQITKLVSPGVKVMVVVKANAYGHGAVQVAKTVLAHGASCLAVARLEEALVLREEGISCPILILGYTPVEGYPELIKHQLTQTVYNWEGAMKLNTVARQMGQRATVHIKIDTGMSRLGFLPSAVDQIVQVTDLPWLEVEGIYTHFAKADSADKSYVKYQHEQFITLLQQLTQRGVVFKIRHAANSAAVIDHPETHLDMVRPGIITYGLYPSTEVACSKLKLKPALSLKSTIAQIKRLPPGTAVSYGCSYVTERESTLATLPLGYADGFSRILTDGEVLVGGRRVPVVGKICMDQCMVNLGDDMQAQAGDEVVVIGSQQQASISVEELADKLNTINYEIICMLKDRVPRIYV